MREPLFRVSVHRGPSISREIRAPTRFPAFAGLGVAVLVATASLSAIVDPSIYARETAPWRVQAIAQDWVDLLVAVPWLAASAIAVLRGSRRALLLLGGALGYAAYSFAVYAFAVHFNPLFLVYCGALGLSAFGLAGLVHASLGMEVRHWFDARTPRRAASAMLMASAAIFALLWLAEIVPATVRGEPPANLAEMGLLTNPIHVLDLSLVLPALFASGLLLWRDRDAGYPLATAWMGFCVLMDVNIAAMTVAMLRSGLHADLAVACAFAGITAAAGVLLVLMLRSVRGPGHSNRRASIGSRREALRAG